MTNHQSKIMKQHFIAPQVVSITTVAETDILTSSNGNTIGIGDPITDGDYSADAPGLLQFGDEELIW